MCRIDTRAAEKPHVVVCDKEVLLIVDHVRYEFSIKAWNFFAANLRVARAREVRYTPDTFVVYLLDRVVYTISDYDELDDCAVGISTFPGCYKGEWWISFFEEQKSEAVSTTFETHWRTPTGKGAVDRMPWLEELFQPIPP